jgi:putative ABC transport system permease protein
VAISRRKNEPPLPSRSRLRRDGRVELVRMRRALRANRPLVAAFVIAGLLVAFSSASGVVFASAAGSAAFKDQVATMTPLGAGLEVMRRGSGREPKATSVLARHRTRTAAIARALGDSSSLGPVVSTLSSSTVEAARGAKSIEIVLMARTGATRHVRRLAGSGDGIWLADSVASYLGVGPGDVIAIRGGLADAPRPPRRVRVGAIYRALWRSEANDYWSNFSHEIYPPRKGDPDMLPTFAFLPAEQLVPLDTAIGARYFDERWEVPVRPEAMTLERARSLADRFGRIGEELASPRSALSTTLGCNLGVLRGVRCATTSSLRAAVGLADRNASAVAGSSALLGSVGTVLALAVAAAGGFFLVARRRGEMRYRFTRGEGTSVFALRTGLESLPAILLGGIVGFVAVIAVVRAFEPHASFDAASLRRAAGVAIGALVVAGALLVSAACVAFLRQFRLPRRGRSLWRRVPWELVPAVAGIALLLALHASRSDHGQTSIAAFALPLLLVAGFGGALLRLARLVVARARPRAVPLSLAVRRVSSGSSLAALLTVIVAVASGVLFYGLAVRESLAEGTRAKAQVAIGGDVQGTIGGDSRLPPLPFPSTKVTVAYGGITLGSATGDQADLMLVEPGRLANVIHWNKAWGASPQQLLPRLEQATGAALAVIVAGTSAGKPLDGAWISGAHVPLRVVGRVRAFPSMSTDRPLLIASADAFSRLGAAAAEISTTGFTYVWARGDERQVERALSGPRVGAAYLLTRHDILSAREVVAAARSYGFLLLLGAASGALALVGLLLYLYARQRSQTLASALLRRMGLRPAAELASLALEVAALLALAALIGAIVAIATVRFVIGSLDPLPQYPPAPDPVTPWLALAATPALVTVVAVLAAGLAQYGSRRANVVEELRGA